MLDARIYLVYHLCNLNVEQLIQDRDENASINLRDAPFDKIRLA